MLRTFWPDRARTAVIGAALLLSGLVVALALAPPSPSHATDVTTVLPSGPAPERPVLEQIRSDAAARGVPLGQAIDEYLQTARASTDPEDEPDGPATTPEVSVDDLTAAELEDLQWVAQDEGQPLETIIESYGWQQLFAKTLDSIEAQFPQDFSGAEIAPDRESAWFGFKGDAPAEAVELIRRLPVPVELTEWRGYTETQLQNATDLVHAAVRALPDVLDVATGLDLKTATITASIDWKPGIVPKPITDLLSEVGLPGVKLVGRTTEHVAEPEDGYIRGGGKLTGSEYCTSGFNLISATTTTKRHGTAGHCTDSGSSNTYSNWSQGGSTTVSPVWYNKGSYGDIGYHTGGSMTFTRTFYYDYDATRYATSRPGRPGNRTVVCHFGRTTGRSCGHVKDNYVDAGGLKGLVQMDSGTSSSGDSGGPWYYGGAAYGIHFGRIDNLSSWTPAGNFKTARNYLVWINAS